MDKPEGCMVPGEEQKVCMLVKSLYGFKISTQTMT